MTDPNSISDPNAGPESPFYPGYQQTTTGLKHSGLGIASFIIAIAIGVIEFIAVIGAGAAVAHSGGAPDEHSPAMIFLGLLICGGVLAVVGGLVLGIIGLFRRDRNRLFAILGVVLNGLIIVGIGGLMVLGFIAKAGR